MATHYLDTSGLICPLPVLKVQKLLRGLAVGDVVEMTATDPNAKKDVPIFCHEQQYKILRQEENNGKWFFVIEK